MCVCVCLCVCVCFFKGGTLDVVAPFFMCRSTKYFGFGNQKRVSDDTLANLNSQAFAEVLMCTKGRFFSAGFCYEYCADGYEAL